VGASIKLDNATMPMLNDGTISAAACLLLLLDDEWLLRDLLLKRYVLRPWDRMNDRITIPGRKYILTCLVQGKKNDSPIELGD